MADAVVKLKVESQEFDNKLARATQQLQHMEKEVRRTGASFEFADKEELAFIQSLGQMETKTQSVRSKMREYTESILSLTEMYERLSDTEKNSDFGKAMLSSIDQIKQRAGELKDNMGDLDAEIKHLASDTSTFDSLAGGVNLLVSTFQVGQGIIQMFGVENENAVKAIAKLQGAMAVTNGLVQLQNALQKESAVMLGVTTLQRKAAAAAAAIEAAAVGKGTVALKAATVAQKALNLAAKANPYVLLATAVVAVGAALFAFAKNSKEANEELGELNMESAKSKQAFEQMAKSYNSINMSVGLVVEKYNRLKNQWEQLTTLQDKQGWIEKNKTAFQELGLSINSVVSADDAFIMKSDKVIEALKARARANAMMNLYEESLKEAYTNADAYAKEQIAGNSELQSLGAPMTKYSKVPDYYKKYLDFSTDTFNANDGYGGMATYLSPTGYEKIKKGEYKKYYDQYLPNGLSYAEDTFSLYYDANKKAEELESKLGNLITNPTVAPTTPSSDVTDTEKVKTAADMWDELQNKIKEAEDRLKEFQAMAANTELSEEQRNWAADMVKKYEEEIKKLKNTKEVIPIQFSDKGINELKNKIKEALSGEIFGSDGYALQATKIVDVTTLENLLNTALTNGLNVDMTYLSGLFESIKLDADIDDSTWDALVAEINEKLEELDLPKIKLDVTTGNITNVAKDAKKSTDAWQQAANAVNNLGGALNNLEDPSAKVAGIIMQAVANIALGFAQAAASPATGAAGVFGWIAAATAGLATMTATISSIKSVTKGGFANGGIVPGNSFSGDNLHTSDYGINSGELILNRSQQNVIASQLQGGAANIRVQGFVKGHDILLAGSNYALSTGKAGAYLPIIAG